MTKRYGSMGGMGFESEFGMWVRWEDHDALEQQLAEMRGALERAETLLERIWQCEVPPNRLLDEVTKWRDERVSLSSPERKEAGKPRHDLAAPVVARGPLTDADLAVIGRALQNIPAGENNSRETSSGWPDSTAGHSQPQTQGKCGYRSYRNHTCKLPAGHAGDHNSRENRKGHFWGTDPDDMPLPGTARAPAAERLVCDTCLDGVVARCYCDEINTPGPAPQFDSARNRRMKAAQPAAEREEPPRCTCGRPDCGGFECTRNNP